MNKVLKMLITAILVFALALPAMAEGTRNTAGQTNGNTGVTTNRVNPGMDNDRDGLFDMNTNNGMNNNAVNNGLGNRNTTGFGTNNVNDGNFRTAAADDGADWGWIGLLGLVGLAGLFNRNRETNR